MSEEVAAMEARLRRENARWARLLRAERRDEDAAPRHAHLFSYYICRLRRDVAALQLDAEWVSEAGRPGLAACALLFHCFFAALIRLAPCFRRSGP